VDPYATMLELTSFAAVIYLFGDMLLQGAVDFYCVVDGDTVSSA